MKILNNMKRKQRKELCKNSLARQKLKLIKQSKSIRQRIRRNKQCNPRMVRLLNKMNRSLKMCLLRRSLMKASVHFTRTY